MRKSKKKPEEISFWQSQSDLLTALVLVLLLIILLLSLYLIKMHKDKKDPWPGDDIASGYVTITPSPTATPTFTPTPSPTPVPDHGGGGGGGGNGDRGDDEGDEPYEEEGEKSAVYVMLVDGDTEMTVKQEGVMFELYKNGGSLQTLATYYPEKIIFRDYETTKDGVFFLPEKIHQGRYYFKNITEAKGYEKASDEYFYLDDYYDWPEPFVVRIPVYPSRNTIRIRLVDADTSTAVTGSLFEVTAAENIVTQDGTTRYRKGEVVSEIELDEKGEGESDELYLGKYLVRQKTIPSHYAEAEEPEIEVEVLKKGESNVTQEFETQKTTLSIRLTDELYPSRAIEGAEFSVKGKGSAKTYVTDASGRIVIDELDKNTVYTVKQTKTADDYYPDETEYKVSVSREGTIEGSAKSELLLTNWILRASIGVTDAVLGSQISDVNLALYDDKDRLVRSWTSSGNAMEINNIEKGTYYVVVNGDMEKKYEMKIENTKEIQKLSISKFTMMDAFILAAAALSAAFILLITVVVIRKIRKRAEGL